MMSSLSFAGPGQTAAATLKHPAAATSEEPVAHASNQLVAGGWRVTPRLIPPAAPQRDLSLQRPGLWRRIRGRFGVDRLRLAAAAEAYGDAIGASLDRLAGLAEGVANEGYRAGEACTNLALQSKTLSEGLIESEVEIDRIARIAAENGSASVAVQAEMKSTAERLDECVDQTRKQGHLIDDLFISVERSRTGFVEVNACVDEVERFLTIVNEIGNQASLLALNAAIEAASAGAHGNGFFVVLMLEMIAVVGAENVVVNERVLIKRIAPAQRRAVHEVAVQRPLKKGTKHRAGQNADASPEKKQQHDK